MTVHAPLDALKPDAVDRAAPLRGVADVSQKFGHRKKTPSRSPIGGVQIVLGVLLLVACAWIYASAQSLILRETLPLFLFSFVICLAPIAFIRDPDPFSPPVYLALLGGIGTLADIAYLLSAENVTFPGMQNLGYGARVHLMNLISLSRVLSSVSYYSGYYLSKGTVASRFFPKMQIRAWSTSRLILVTAICGLAFVVAYAFFQSGGAGGLSTLSQSTGKAVLHQDRSATWMERGVQLGMLPFYLLSARFSARSKKPYAQLVVLAIGAALMAYLSLREGGRGGAVFFVITIGIIIHYIWKRIPLWFVLPVAFGVIAGITVLGELRSSASNSESMRQFQPAGVMAEHAQDRGRLSAAAVVLDTFPDRIPYLNGASFAALPLAPIPKWILPNKSAIVEWQDNGIVMRLIGVPAPTEFPMVLYANFSWVGIAIGMTLWGAFHRGLYEWLWSGELKSTAPLYATILVLFSFTSLGFGAAVGTTIPLFMALRFIQLRAKPVPST